MCAVDNIFIKALDGYIFIPASYGHILWELRDTPWLLIFEVQ